MAVEKLVRNGKVAILYSPEYGAGWSTWNESHHTEILLFDKEIVEAVLEGNKEKAAQIAKRKCDGKYFCILGLANLEVAWLDEGTVFKIDEHDGCESVRLVSYKDFFVA
jgi:hypothetical protein